MPLIYFIEQVILFMKKWSIGKPDPKAAAELSGKGGLPSICASILVSRGIDTLEKAQSFFNYNPDGSSSLSDPFLIKDMAEAADILLKAVDDGIFICVYGDYDCDGITATAILYTYLECLGANVKYHINMRDDGYGLCESAVRKLAEEGVQLIVTVDNGISAIKEADAAKELGITLIITDHHQPGEILPDAAAVVDPHRSDCSSPFKELCGCGVALKLIAAMDGGDYSMALEQFSDLAAIATIADIVPIVGENREIVATGLHYLENTENYGLKSLIECAKLKKSPDSVSVAFSLSPRINASGRFGSASDAVKMLISDDPDTSRQYAQLLDKLNSDRKEAEKEIMDSIEQRITADPALLYKRVLVIYGEGWHHGVIGIVAARLVERFGKPVFIMSDDGGEARGSARSVEGFSIFEALSSCADILTKFGGHSGAGGFSLPIERISDFDDALQNYAAESFENMPVFSIHADKLLMPDELCVDTIKAIDILKPFGEGNKQPVFLMHPVRLLEVTPLSQGAHTKLKLTYGNKGVFGLMFGQKTAEFPYKEGDMLDLLVCPEINSYNGNESVVVRIIDCRSSGISQAKYFSAKDVYEQYRRGEKIDSRLIPRFVPKREDLAAVYKLMPKSGRYISCDLIFSKLSDTGMSYCMFRTALDVFEELGLVSINHYSDCAAIIPNAPKADISSSKILQQLNSLN